MAPVMHRTRWTHQAEVAFSLIRNITREHRIYRPLWIPVPVSFISLSLHSYGAYFAALKHADGQERDGHIRCPSSKAD